MECRVNIEPDLARRFARKMDHAQSACHQVAFADRLWSDQRPVARASRLPGTIVEQAHALGQLCQISSKILCQIIRKVTGRLRIKATWDLLFEE